MAELLPCSQSSLFLLPKYRLQSPSRGWKCNAYHLSPPSAAFSHLSGTNSTKSPTICVQEILTSCRIRPDVVLDPTMPTTFILDYGAESDDSEDLFTEIGGGDNEGGRGGGGGGGGGNNNSGDDGDSEESGEAKDDANKKKSGISMSQKLTLGYAFLLGAGGAIGYFKSGSQKSIIAGGLSAALLYYVYTLLPTRPVIASSLGFGISAALLGVMGPRFKNSGNIFPAGIVSLVSLIMSGGYLHGIIRSAH